MGGIVVVSGFCLCNGEGFAPRVWFFVCLLGDCSSNIAEIDDLGNFRTTPSSEVGVPVGLEGVTHKVLLGILVIALVYHGGGKV